MKLTQELSRILERPVTSETPLTEEDGFDSLARIELLSLLDIHCNVSLSADELIACKTAGALQQLLEQKEATV